MIFCKKERSENVLQNSQENSWARVSSFNKAAGLVFSYEFRKFLQNGSKRLVLAFFSVVQEGFCSQSRPSKRLPELVNKQS